MSSFCLKYLGNKSKGKEKSEHGTLKTTRTKICSQCRLLSSRSLEIRAGFCLKARSLKDTLRKITLAPSASTVQGCTRALAGVARWIECRPAKQKVASSFPVRARAWAAGQVPSRGPVGATTHRCFSPFLSASLHIALKINKT